ncbi:I2BP1 protein, partial [Rhabdornis inornatus]|nr:I2BP1 protein [Rhabdornis inornatus]
AWRRQWCHLCELPKPPWAVVGDFSQAVCRGCVNFEGAGRVELLLAAARRLRGHHEATSVPPSVPKELREALCTERHLWGHHEATSVPPSVPKELSQAFHVTFGGTERHRHHHATTTRAVSPSVPMELSRHHATRAVSPSVPLELSEALCSRVTSEGTERRHHATTPAMSPAVPAALQRHQATPAVSPAMSPAVPAALSAALAEAWPGKPRAVRERLSVLAGCAPFAVRFRKDHALVGRVLAFDAAPRAGPGGGDFELRLFAEYPCGSGSVYGALGLARRMFQDCLRAPGKSISSGYKYLEYEKRQGSGEWRLLAELFTESVRLFRLPPSPEALPQQQQRCHRHLSLSPLSPPPPRRRRKASPEARVVAGEALSCGRCRRLLEDTHFVQCPAVPRHRFCFPCARRAIRARGPGSAVHCPSGGRCPLAGSGLPWAFMQGEIAAILAGDVRVKRERDP